MAMTAAVKDELSRVDVPKPCCRRSEMAALLRFSGGLQAQASYVYGHQFASNFLTLRRPLVDLRQTGDPGDITNTFKLNLVYDLPFGQGHRIGSSANAFIRSRRLSRSWTCRGRGRSIRRADWLRAHR